MTPGIKAGWISAAVCALILLAVLLPRNCRQAHLAATLPGDKVYYGSTTRIRGFDPAKAGDVASSLAIGKVYEGLVQYAYTNRPYRIIPLLAETLPEVSDNGRIYTFHVRTNIYFQDDACFVRTGGRGRQLTARDFIYAIQRVADLKNASTGYWAFNDRIEGLDEFRAASGGDTPTDYDAEVAGLRALDAHTLQITLKRPYPQLLWILAMPYAWAIPREAVEYYGAAFIQHPVGTGPYVLREWRDNYRLDFVRNPTWQATGRDREETARDAAWSDASDAPGQASNEPFPRIGRLVQFFVGDPTTRWLMFLNGELDLYVDIARDNEDVIFSAGRGLNAELAQRGIRLHSLAGLNVYYIGFNMDDPVVGKNKLLRQALSCAVNTAEWVDYYRGRIQRAAGPIPPGVAGSRSQPNPYEFDLERAGRLLNEAGYPGGRDPATGRRLELTLELGQTDTEMRESTELLVGFMDRLGIVVNTSYNNKAALFKKIERREAQMFRLSWFADYPDAENFLQLFYSPNSSPGPNRVNYANPEFDRLYERVREMPDSPERTRLYEEMADLVLADAPWIFLHYPVDYSLSRDWLVGFAPHDFPYGMEKYWDLTAHRPPR